MESAVIALVWVMAAVLGWAGVAKLRRPSGTRQALRLAGLPDAAVLVRLLGAAELGVAGWALVAGGVVPALLLAATYAAFTGFAARERTRPSATCGCFGDEAAPLTALHVAVDGGGAIVGLAAAVVAAPGMPAAVGDEPLTLGVAVLAVGVAAALVTVLLTALPALADALRTSAVGTGPRVGGAATAAAGPREGRS